MNRRNFVRVGAGSIAGATLMPAMSMAHRSKANAKLKVVMVGTGSRGIRSWGIDLVGPYEQYVEMVGLCDINQKRVEVAKEMIGANAKTYHSDDFDKMIRERYL